MFTVFGAESFSDLGAKLGAMFGASGIELSGEYTLYVLRNYALIIVAALVGATPLLKNAVEKAMKTSAGESIILSFRPIALAVLLIVCTAFLVDGSFSPFMYFRF